MQKKDVLKNLLAKNEISIPIEQSEFELEFYDNLANYSFNRLKNMATRVQNLTGLKDIKSKMLKRVLCNNIMVYILRLKQCCDSPWLVVKNMSRLSNVKSLKEASKLLEYYNMSKQTDEECPICYDNLADVIASPCGHKCCQKCWDALCKLKIKSCPKCRREVESLENINDKKYEKCEDVMNNVAIFELKNSSKIQNLINIIKEKLDKDEKSCRSKSMGSQECQRDCS